MPSFIWRPSSFVGPENGATMPNRISLAVTPRAVEVGTGCGTGAVGAVAAAAEDGATTAASDGEGEGAFPASDCSRSASWRSADLQSVRPAVTALRPSAT